MGRGKEAQDARPWLARSQEAGPKAICLSVHSFCSIGSLPEATAKGFQQLLANGRTNTRPLIKEDFFL